MAKSFRCAATKRRRASSGTIRSITAKPIRAYAWAVHVAQVAVDTVTYSAEVEEFWAVQEVGRVLNPVLAAGQIEGGIAQGIGYALYEKVVWQNGRMANNQMTNYIMPTAEDVPPIHVYFEEIPFRLRRIRRQRHRRIAPRRPRARDSECDPATPQASLPFDSAAARRSLSPGLPLSQPVEEPAP